MEQIKSALNNLLLQINSTENFTNENHNILNGVFIEFKTIIKELNNNDPNKFNNLADTSDITSTKELITGSRSEKDKKSFYNTYRDHLIHLIELTINRL